MGYCGVDVISRTTIGDISLIYSLQYCIYIYSGILWDKEPYNQAFYGDIMG